MSNKIRLRKKASSSRHQKPRNDMQQTGGSAQLIRTALSFHRSGRYNEAAGCYRQILALEPDHPDANYLLGTLYYENFDNEAALPLVEKTIRAKPNFADAYNLMGSINHASGHNEEALRNYRQALRCEPRLAVAHNNLGLVLEAEGRNEEALECYNRALAIDPNYAGAYANLGHVCRALGRFDQAMAGYWRALSLNPNLPGGVGNFSTLVKLSKTLPEIIPPAERRKLLIHCLSRNDVDGQMFFSACLHELISAEVREAVGEFLAAAENDEAVQPFLDKPPLARLLFDQLFLLMLNRTRVADPFAERFLTALRKGLASLLAVNNPDNVIYKQLLPLLCALARQCFWNEYLFPLGAEEEQCCAELAGALRQADSLTTPVSVCRLALLACYAPLGSWELDRALPENLALVGPEFSALLLTQVGEVALEKKLAVEMPALAEIDDSVSRQVRQQYEENPYPRWISISFPQPRPFAEWLRQDIAPNRPADLVFSPRPQVLVAGGGSGQQPVFTALSYLGSSVLTMDLSRASLAYGKRKAAELGLANIDFIQGDILSLPSLGREFDVIVCSGVLHHMGEPARGLGALVECLKPGGYMNIGLYSELARQHIVAAREFVTAGGFSPTAEGIRASRQALFSLPEGHVAKQAIRNNDFYSTSTVRDLIFHVQEIRYTLPGISRLLDEFNLEFLGFILGSEVKNNYLATIEGDPAATSLAGWDRYEQVHPDTFFGMYNFWVRKR